MTHMDSETYYDVLGVTRDFPTGAIGGLRASLAKIYHPDGGSQPDADRMSRINDACDVLGDHVLREAYDRRLTHLYSTRWPGARVAERFGTQTRSLRGYSGTFVHDQGRAGHNRMRALKTLGLV